MTSSLHRLRDILEMSQFITFSVVIPAAHTGRDAPRQLVDINGLNIFFSSAPDQRTAGSFPQSSNAAAVVTSRHITHSKPLCTQE